MGQANESRRPARTRHNLSYRASQATSFCLEALRPSASIPAFVSRSTSRLEGQTKFPIINVVRGLSSVLIKIVSKVINQTF